MELRTLIVDSDPRVCRVLSRWIGHSRYLTLSGQAFGVAQAVNYLKRCVPHVVFCSVELVDGSGFEVLESLSPSTQAVITSTTSIHALRAFDVAACDYLLKPLRLDRLCRTEERLVARYCREHRVSLPDDIRLLVDTGGRHVRVGVDELVAIVAVGGNYTEVHRASGPSLETRRSIKEWQEGLPKDRFIRTHRSSLVNLQFALGLERTQNGGRALSVQPLPMHLPVSRRLVATLAQALRKSRKSDFAEPRSRAPVRC